AKHYIRYADDFVIFSEKKLWLEKIIMSINIFLNNSLKLELHPGKISITTINSGVDFLGWVNFPDHRTLRTTTKRRMLKKLAAMENFAVLNSYFGLLKHGSTSKLKSKVINKIAFKLSFTYGTYN
ncbi:MAG: RNA-directed DNA polymerase (Reverse transcriptase), partial [Parcubacteria group bacterium GW2011_GWA1_45_7]